jgi:hypothetical protein
MVQLVIACQNVFTVTRGVPIQFDRGGIVTDPRTSASIEIPPYTLKEDVEVNVITLDSSSQIDRIDHDCGVDIQPGETFPDVSGFVPATNVVRYEVQPCGNLAFGPGSAITLPLLRSRFPNGLPIGTSLRLFELAKIDGQLMFLNTGIEAKVTGPGRSRGFGDFVVVPDIQVFSTFAVFQSVGASAEPSALTQLPGGRQLYFPVINQQARRRTRISIANPDPSAALNVTFTAYNEAGAIAGTQSRLIAANRQAVYQVSDLFPSLVNGTVVAVGQGGAMTGSYEVADDFSAPTTLAGADAIQQPYPALIFPVVKSVSGSFTDIHLFNPNPIPVSLRLAGFTSMGARIDPMNAGGRPIDSLALPPLGTLIVSSAALSSVYDVRLPFNNLDGGCVIVQTTDGQAVLGGEIFSEMMSGQRPLTALNGLRSPSGCLASTVDPFGCHTDDSPASAVASSIRQHTLYAMYMEADPAESLVRLINISDQPARVALSVFSESNQYRATSPTTGFTMVGPHQIMQASIRSLFGFNPAPGYIRVEDKDSAFVGSLINRVSGRYTTAVPVVPDDPRVSQTMTNTFFSRVQLDPETANPRMLTGLLIFNPNNNPLRLTITVTDAGGATRTSPAQTIPGRGSYVDVRRSLSVLFPDFFIRNGFVQVQVTSALEPGMGGRIMPVATYRSSNYVSTVLSQTKQPE